MLLPGESTEGTTPETSVGGGTSSLAVKVDVPLGAPPVEAPAQPATPDFESIIPEKFKTDEHKAWLDSIRNSENPNKLEVMIDQMHNAQKMVGGKVNIPGENATPEEIQAFNRAMGVPEKAEDYKFEPNQWDEASKEVGDLLNASQTPEYMAEVAKMFHEVGVPPKMAQALMNRFNQLTVAQHGDTMRQIAEAQKVVEEDLSNRFNRWYGADGARVSENSQKLVQAAMADPRTPADARVTIGALGNDFVLALAPILDHVTRTYIKEDTAGARSSLGKSDTQAAPQTIAELRAIGGKLQSQPEYRNPLHPGHAAAKAKVDEVYAEIGRLLKAGKK